MVRQLTNAEAAAYFASKPAAEPAEILLVNADLGMTTTMPLDRPAKLDRDFYVEATDQQELIPQILIKW